MSTLKCVCRNEQKAYYKTENIGRPLVDGYDRYWKAYRSGHKCVTNTEWVIMDFRFMVPWK